MKTFLDTIGIGIDVVEVDRFKQIPYKKKPSFYKKIFTSNEINYCLKFNEPYTHFAGKFAAKEALKKSISVNVNMLDIETSYSHDKPIIKLKKNNNYKFKLSISHEEKVAVAVIMSQKVK